MREFSEKFCQEEFHFLIEELEPNHGAFQMYFKMSVGQFEALLLILMQQLPN